MNLDGIHHVTCITGDAPENLRFYTGVLGLRLVAKSVNQDDPGVYHLFYADEEGHPGSDLTFFEYPGARRGRAGSGMVYRVSFRIGGDALDLWRERLAAHGVAVESMPNALQFADTEGLGLELVVSTNADPPLRARHPEIPEEMAIRGFEGVRVFGAPSSAARFVLEDVLAAQPVAANEWELRGSRRGARIAFDTPPGNPGRPGAGTVHHVAWHTSAGDHPLWLDRLRQKGVNSTPIIDRHYFHSIYFREPTGVLFEIADDAPGFTVDDPVEDLGTRVILPPFLEQRRAEIEGHLTPLPDPRAEWTMPADQDQRGA